MFLHFFPGLLPLASLAPVLLAIIGILASWVSRVQKLRKKPHLVWKLLAIIVITGAFVWGVVRTFQQEKSARARNLLPEQLVPENLPEIASTHTWNQWLPRAALSNLSFSARHRLLFYGTRKTLDAISIDTGKLAFSLQFAEPILSEPLVIENRLYVGEGLHEAKRARLVAIQLPQGKPLWQHEFSSHLESPPQYSIIQNSLIGCAGEAGVYALEAQSGKLLWENPIGHCDSTPWLESQSIFALVRSKQGSSLAGLNLRDGKAESIVTLSGDPWGTLVRDEHTGYLVATTGVGQLSQVPSNVEKGWLHAINIETKRLVWSQTLSGMPLPIGDLFRTKDRALTIHTLKKGEIWAFNVQNGALEWKVKLSSPILSSARLIPESERLVALSLDGTLFEIDAGTGKLFSQIQLGPQSTSAPAFGDQHAFFADRARLWAIRVSKGRLWP